MMLDFSPLRPRIITAEEITRPSSIFLQNLIAAKKMRLAEAEQARKEKRDQELHEATMAQLEDQRTRTALQQRRDDTAYQRAEAEGQTKAQKLINERLLMGDTAGAERLALAYGVVARQAGQPTFRQILPSPPPDVGEQDVPLPPPSAAPDPSTALERGGLMRPGGLGLGTEMRLRPPPAGQEGPAEQISADMPLNPANGRERAIEQGGLLQPGGLGLEVPGDISERYATDKAAFPALLAAAKARPVFEAQSKIGAVRFDPRAEEEFKARQHAEAADRIQQIAVQMDDTDPYWAQEVNLVATKVRQQLVSPEQANKDLNFLLEQRNRKDIAATSAEQRERLARSRDAAISASRQVNATERQMTNDLALVNSFNAEAQRFNTRLSGSETVRGLRGYADALKRLRGTPLEQRSVVYSMAREMNGAGILSNQDLSDIAAHIAGKYAQGQTLWNTWFSNGQMGEDEAAYVTQTVKNRILQKNAQAAALAKSFRTQFLGSGSVYLPIAPHIQNWAKAFFGDYLGSQGVDMGELVPPTSRTPLPRGDAKGGKAGGGGSRSIKVRAPTAAEANELMKEWGFR